MRPVPASRSTSHETAPLLAPTNPPVSCCDGDERSLGTAQFPLHPAASTTPRWRKLLLLFFDGHHAIQALRDNDVWPLEPQFQGACAAADLKAQIPPHGHRLRLFRAVVSVNRQRLLGMAALNILTVVLAAMRPLLLFRLLSVDETKGDNVSVFAPLMAMVIARIGFTFVICHCYVLMDRVQLQLYSSLYAMITDHVATGGAPTKHSAVDTDTARRGHKHRLEEVTKLLANDLSNVGELFIIVFDAWTVVLKLSVSIAVLVQVVDISWHTIAIAFGVYATVLVVETVVGAPLVARAESTLLTRLNTVHECLKGIQMVKLNAWEDKMQAKIQCARDNERAAATRLRVLALFTRQLIDESPMVLAAVLFGFMSSGDLGHDKAFTPARVFTALLLLSDCLRYGRYFKYAFEQSLAGVAAWRRVEDFVLGDDTFKIETADDVADSMPSYSVSDVAIDDVLVELSGVCLTASDNITSSPTLLVNVHWSLHRGELVIVHGAAGVGKSMLLAAVRGDTSAVRVLNGLAQPLPRDCRVAYCSQNPWLQTLSIRDNILFGTAFAEDKYWTIVDACGLLEDLDALPAGDATVVGPRGINVSSGQSARIALARACYADADLYLLDCPLANVDAVVQSEIFRKCIVELLMFKTVVIVTHNPEYIGSSYVDQLVEVKPLTVRVSNRRSRTHSETRSGVYRSRRLRDRGRDVSRRPMAHGSLVVTPLSSDSRLLVERLQAKRTTVKSPNPSRFNEGHLSIVPLQSVQAYLWGNSRHTGVQWASVVISLFVWGSLCVARDLWVMLWAATVSMPRESVALPSWSVVNEYGPTVYAWLVVACIVVCLAVRAIVIVIASTSAAQLFTTMTGALLHAPMTLFYHTPLGETINRYLTDMATVDELLPRQLTELALCMASFVARTMVLGWCLGPVGVVVIVAGYAAVARTLSLKFRIEIILMRLRVNAKLLTLLSEIVDGEAVVRAFGKDRAAHVFRSLDTVNDTFKRVTYLATMFNSTTVLHCDAVSTVLVLALLGILARQSVPPAEFGLVLLYIFTMQQNIVVQFGTGLGNTCVAFHSVDRLREYGAIAGEVECYAAAGSVKAAATHEWPQFGQIDFDNVRFAYADKSTDVDSRLALRDVSFSLRGGEKVGVIGRTGSGKSSLAMALLRVHPLRSGRILLDGVDLRTVPLAQLRRSFTMIPQSPTFYRCSIRDYLDPFHEFDDARLWKELLTVDLGQRVQSLEEELLDNGENWSLGQRQLLCFARALLTPSRVVVLDEAFSCVDQSCQEKILRILRERFASSTVVLITHRLDQILAFDRIVVMKGGRVVENGSAAELASDAGSVFYEFLETSLLTF